MQNIPRWLQAALKTTKLKCHKCDKIFNCNHLRAIGVRDSYQKKDVETLFVELMCLNCSEMTLFELKDMTLIELSYEIMDDLEIPPEDVVKREKMDLGEELDHKITKGHFMKKKRKRSKITLKEIKESAKFLENVDTHEEFLIAIGLSPEDIDKYNMKDKKENKND